METFTNHSYNPFLLSISLCSSVCTGSWPFATATTDMQSFSKQSYGAFFVCVWRTSWRQRSQSWRQQSGWLFLSWSHWWLSLWCCAAHNRLSPPLLWISHNLLPSLRREKPHWCPTSHHSLGGGVKKGDNSVSPDQGQDHLNHFNIQHLTAILTEGIFTPS